MQDARAKLQQLYRQVRALDLDEAGGALTAVADLVLLYASTRQWLACGELLAGGLAGWVAWLGWTRGRPSRFGSVRLPLPAAPSAGRHRFTAPHLPTCPPAHHPTRPLPAEKDYRGFTSTPVPLNLEDLTLDRAGTGGGAAAAADGEPSGGGSRPGSRPGSVQDLSAAGSESDGGALSECGVRCRCGWGWLQALARGLASKHQHVQPGLA